MAYNMPDDCRECPICGQPIFGSTSCCGWPPRNENGTFKKYTPSETKE